MRVTRLVGIGVAVLAVVAAAAAFAPVVRAQRAGVARVAQAAQDRVMTIAPQVQMLTTGGPQIGVTIKDTVKGEGAEVTDSSAAAKAGLKAGDVITAVGGKPVRDSLELARAIRDAKEGTDVAIGIVRDRKPQTLTARLEAASPARRIVVRRGIRV